jgi:hypothetical protein
MMAGLLKKFVLRSALLFAAILLVPQGLLAEENITISGRISSIGGEPVAGAEVYLYSSANTRKPADYISQKSSPAGSYRMIVPKADYRAIARIKKGERYGPLMPGDRHSGEPVKVVPDDGKELTLDFTVADMQELAQRQEKDRGELGEIYGTVSATGSSIASIYVYARTGRISATMPEYYSGWVAADGKFSLKLPPGRYFLGTATEFPLPENPAVLKEIMVSAGKLPVAIDLQFPLQ